MTEHAESLARLMVAENGKALRERAGRCWYAAEFFLVAGTPKRRCEWSACSCRRLPGRTRSWSCASPSASRCWSPRNFLGRDGHPQDRPGAGGRLHGSAQAGLGDPADRAGHRLLAEAGVPDGVVNVLPSWSRGAVVSAMLNDPRVRKLSFTGVYREAGRILLREAADTVVNTSMELGGNAPFIIFEDADIERRRRGGADRQDAQRRRGVTARLSVHGTPGGGRRSSAASSWPAGRHGRRAGPGRGHRRGPAGQ